MSPTRRLFGTDGIRGTANTDPMTAETALRLGQAAGLLFTRGAHRHRVVIGKDTRLSGYMIEPALVAGFIGAGMDVVLVGPLPTPAIAMLTRSLRADLGVMISASHNPFEDNGIKLFGPDGFKLSDETEAEIEALMATDLSGRGSPRRLGSAARRVWTTPPGAISRPSKMSFPRGLRLDGLKIVVDCAQRRRLPRGADRAVGTRRGGDPDRRRAGRLQHQSRLRLDGAGIHVRRGAPAWRESRPGAGRRCRPADRVATRTAPSSTATRSWRSSPAPGARRAGWRAAAWSRP